MTTPTTQALAEDALGVALLHIERGDRAATAPLLAEAVAGGVSTGGNASLFHGAPALEFVLGCAGHRDRDVQAAVDRVVAHRLASARQRSMMARLPDTAEFDLVRGLTGLGALLLTRAAPSPLLEEVLAYLVSLARPAEAGDAAGGAGLPGWWSSTGPGHTSVPGGCGDNGMAHGIAGPLALLAIAARRSVQVTGHLDAIQTFAHWLEDFGGFYWVTRDQLTGTPPVPPPTRPSWCYGTLGIARSLQMAGLALGDPARRKAAEDLALAALTDPARLALITDASLCHGWAGVLTATRAIAADSPAGTPAQDRFTECIHQLGEHLATRIDALGKPGFVEGRAGAQLALDGSNATGWTRALLID
ncbi:lanthionine synthetase C family protein [Actinomadura geliboluensis]|uniref:lanthionine synthetase C family protein n=1 Tax=Actinomadura geliboluensis TaxID=882440 RepID=UPI00263725CC|nr:lanthionine synthetase C family protein [Actinomadura geliboluensis]